jgi:hypothetical protein
MRETNSFFFFFFGTIDYKNISPNYFLTLKQTFIIKLKTTVKIIIIEHSRHESMTGIINPPSLFSQPHPRAP